MFAQLRLAGAHILESVPPRGVRLFASQRFRQKFPNSHGGRGGGQARARAESDKELLGRTKERRIRDDGLMGKNNYELDSEKLAALKWTDLISKDEEDLPKMQGVSSVPTKALEEHRLLSLPLVNSLIHNRKYEWLTPVQAQTLLPILRGESVVVRAKTGTGKTAAFAIPILQKVIERRRLTPGEGKVRALIVSPTRELAQQIADEVYKITQFGGLNQIKVQSLVGGVSKDRQLRAAGLDPGAPPRRVADIIVATPGRLRDVLDDPDVTDKFDNLQVRVFDEADRILDIGFEREMHEIREILDEANQGREIPLLLFSATADRTMREFARKQFGDRVKVVDTVPKDEPTANELVTQHSVACHNWAEIYESATQTIMNAYENTKENGGNLKAIVFLPTTVMVDHYEKVLKKMLGYRSKIPVLGVHGQRSQQSRQHRSDLFRRERNAILITTDVVARGMDFPRVSHVFQLGPPPDVSSYIHRIGRTARIGNSGDSYLYYTNHVRGFIDALAREGIKPSMNLFSSDPEFRERFTAAVQDVTDDDEAGQEVLHSLMSYMTVLKSKFNVAPREFLKDMQPFVDLLGQTKLRLSFQQRQTWSPEPPKRKSSGYGSSRRSRMRW